MSDPILSIRGLRKEYGTGVEALKSVDLDIRRGEIFALLGPNGAGKTTLINIVCGIVTATERRSAGRRQELADGFPPCAGADWPRPAGAYHRSLRDRCGTPSPSRAGCSASRATTPMIEDLLKRLSLWDKRKTIMMHLSGGMKRRVMIAKALSHEPDILFLDEPTAGVDVELRRDMWDLVRKLRADGTTIILTTHYIEEAEEMADRVGVISRGELIAVDEKQR